MRMISLKSILPKATDVPVTDINGEPHLWAIDLSMAITGKNRNDAGKVLRNLKPSLFDTANITEMNLAENAGRMTKLIPFKYTIALVMVLPGDIAKTARSQCCELIARFIAGDQTLHPEINANANSTEPLPSIARASLKSHAAVDAQVANAKRACIAQPQDAVRAAYEMRRKIIHDTLDDIATLETRIKDEGARRVLNNMILSNTQSFITIPMTPVAEKSRPKHGHVYCIQSTRQPEVVKIGLTTTTVKQRIQQVNYQRKKEGINDPFVYKYSVRTLDAEGDEKLTHAHFASVRISGRGELFRTTPESVRDFFDNVIKPRYLLESGTDDYDPVDMDMDVDEAEMPVDTDNPDMDADACVDEGPSDMPMPAPTDTLIDKLKAFIIAHLEYREGSFVASSEIREVFLRHTGTAPELFKPSGSSLFRYMSVWLNSANDQYKDGVLIAGVYPKTKQVPYLRKTMQVYTNLTWKDGPMTDVVRETQQALASASPMPAHCARSVCPAVEQVDEFGLPLASASSAHERS